MSSAVGALRGAQRGGLAEGAVRQVILVVALDHPQHGCGVSLIEDQNSVEDLAADRPDEALGDRVGQRRRLHLIEPMRPIGIGGCM